ncbi:hypothetical protein HDU96_008656 [Phlyctochytrium bullatum]|nr:hypothetical protein HDU96_008656 [Phlyctochytrium bullatum]
MSWNVLGISTPIPANERLHLQENLDLLPADTSILDEVAGTYPDSPTSPYSWLPMRVYVTQLLKSMAVAWEQDGLEHPERKTAKPTQS